MTRPLDTGVRVYWKVNDIIRHKQTGHPFLVVDMRKYVCTFVVDLEDKRQLRPTLTLLPAHYDEYCVDWEMDEKKLGRNDIALEYNPFDGEEQEMKYL